MRVVVGNSIASLVSLSTVKEEALWFSSGTGPSGVWGGFEHKGRILDYGFVNFELDLNVPSDKTVGYSYDPFSVNSCARFLDDISKFVGDRTKTAPLPPVKIFFEGRYFDDFLLSNNLNGLQDFYRAYFPEEVGGISESSKMSLPHPRHKYLKPWDQAFEAIGYRDYSNSAYGTGFAELLRVWGEKIGGDAYNVVSALRHRGLLLPLYYPETVAKALVGEVELPSTIFSSPEGQTVSEFVHELYRSVEKTTPRLDLEDDGNRVKLASLLEDSAANEIVWGASIDDLGKLIGADIAAPRLGSRQSITLLFFEVEVDGAHFDYSLLNMGQNQDWYRMTLIPNVQFGSLRILALETKSPDAISDPEAFFSDFNLRRPNLIKIVRNLPAFTTMPPSDFIELRSLFKSIHKRFSEISFVGPASFTYSTTFNDHVVQGLKSWRSSYE